MNSINIKNKFPTILFFLMCGQLLTMSISIAAQSILFGASILLVIIWSVMEKRWIFPRTPLDYFFLAYIFIELLTSATAVYPAEALNHSRRLLLIIFVYLIILSFTTQKRIILLLIVLNSVTSFLSIIEIIFYFVEHQERLFVFQHYMTTGGIKMILCLLTIPFLIHRDTPKKQKIIFSITLLPIFIALILTNV